MKRGSNHANGLGDNDRPQGHRPRRRRHAAARLRRVRVASQRTRRRPVDAASRAPTTRSPPSAPRHHNHGQPPWRGPYHRSRPSPSRRRGRRSLNDAAGTVVDPKAGREHETSNSEAFSWIALPRERESARARVCSRSKLEAESSTCRPSARPGRSAGSRGPTGRAAPAAPRPRPRPPRPRRPRARPERTSAHAAPGPPPGTALPAAHLRVPPRRSTRRWPTRRLRRRGLDRGKRGLHRHESTPHRASRSTVVVLRPHHAAKAAAAAWRALVVLERSRRRRSVTR